MSNNETPETLRNLINALIGKRNIHISLHDISGILKNDITSVEYDFQRHSKPLCTAAKSGPKGYTPCTDCKKKANQKAMELKEAYCGHCEFGIFEVVKPVVISNKVYCIIYVGNMIIDRGKTYSKMQTACQRHSIPYEKVAKHLKECEYIESPDEYFIIANLVESYIKMLFELGKSVSMGNSDSEYHWAVSTMLEHINAHYMENITLENISELFYMNPKYMGRIFKKETGYTFRECLNEIRIKKAVELLEQTDKTVLEIAMLAGFQNVTYFNRIFNKRYNTTPTKYRINLRRMKNA